MKLLTALIVSANALSLAWAATSVDLVEGGPMPKSLGAQLANMRVGGLTIGVSTPDAAGNSLRVVSTVNDPTVTTIRMQQLYRGMRVEGGEILDHRLSDGTRTVTGRFTENIDADIGNVNAENYDPSDALVRMKRRCLAAQFKGQSMADLEFRNEKSDVIVYAGEEGTDTAVVCYSINFFVSSMTDDNKKAHRMYYIIRADNGRILEEYDGLTNAEIGTGPGGNQEVGKYEYGTTAPYGKLDVTVSGSRCSLESPRVKTVNLDGKRAASSTAFSFDCFRHASDAINGANSPLNDAHYFGEQVYKMYNDWYGAPPLTFQLVQRVHYGRRYENAFWDGAAMTYGDGHTFFYPLTTLDTTCHEVSHGVTEQHSNLVYRGQSGGINEAFSDMAGKACEYYVFGAVKNWQSGQDITKSNKPLRYFDTPTADGDSIDHVRHFKSGMDVHHSSGVYNHVFYKIATAKGWNAKKAFDCFVCANKNQWTSRMNYAQAAVGVLACAKSLGHEEAVVVAAFEVVGICLPGATSSCGTSGSRTTKSRPQPGTGGTTKAGSTSTTGSASSAGSTGSTWNWSTAFDDAVGSRSTPGFGSSSKTGNTGATASTRSWSTRGSRGSTSPWNTGSTGSTGSTSDGGWPI